MQENKNVLNIKRYPVHLFNYGSLYIHMLSKINFPQSVYLFIFVPFADSIRWERVAFSMLRTWLELKVT